MKKEGEEKMKKDNPLLSMPQHHAVSQDIGLKQKRFKKEFYKQKLQEIERNANGDIDFPGEHFPPLHIVASGNSDANSNSSNNGEDDDDYDQDRTQDSVWNQLLRIPLTDDVVRTVAYNTPDIMVSVLPPAIKKADENPHKVEVFDDDNDIDDSAELAPPSEVPPPLAERDPDYYPGGDFVDDTRNATAEEEGFQGGFEDSLITIPASVSACLNTVGERNFAEFADDDNVDNTANVTNVHPRAHIGEEFDAGGDLADVLRQPGTHVDPIEKDRFVKLPPPIIEHATPQKESPLDFGDSDVPISEASLPVADSTFQGFGLETGASQKTNPRLAEHDYRFGLMSSFQDRNADVQPLLDGAVRLAAKWAQKENLLADQMFIEGTQTFTEPLVDKDEMEGGGEAHVGEEKEAAQ
eukprot:CAMPEP_0173100552 /NCGR_PEP_ID=MMETSP1102-20130122/36274_1 /TAXON_ID=49646 /ORGANISM="Geminigera sp., Strain Caron Lab Isolate" /LENGTH=409 /DNA_ID=CAMNT_0013994021 /DNA_START=15 /DNA_END=1244 /DNA_ORIENTATION=+